MNIRLLKGLLILFYLLPFAGYSQVTITATATKVACVGDASITVNVTNVAGPITYAVARLPYNEASVITSTSPVITNLSAGDYYYGYYDGTTFVRATASIKVESTYSTVSPTITGTSVVNYTYCGNDPNPLGIVSALFTGGNAPYTLRLLNASDNSEVQKITTSSSSHFFSNVLPGTYRLELMDNCGVTTTSINTLILAANVTLKDSDIVVAVSGSLGRVEIVYNTPGDVCSGIASAALPDAANVMGSFGIRTTLSPPFITGSSYNQSLFSYKLEIQNGTGWDVYDNLTFAQFRGRFLLPSDRSKWGLLRATGTYCGFSRTTTLDLGASNIGKVQDLGAASFRIEDDRANTICAATGKVAITAYGYGGCLPYTVQVTNTATNTTQTYTSVGTQTTLSFLVDIGQTYTFKLTDKNGTEAPGYSFSNFTSNANTPRPAVTGPNNVFIDPTYFARAPVDGRSLISFYRRPSGVNFNKSALAVIFPSSGFTGTLTASLISGPSPLTFIDLNMSINGKKAVNLGENLTPGTYKIRLKDAGCFDEVYDVELSCYFSKIEITAVTSAPSATICDRYVKKVNVSVSMVGTADQYANPFMFSTFPIYVRTVSGPVSGSGSAGASYSNQEYLRERSYEFVYTDQVSGTYEIGLSKKNNGVFLATSDLWEGTTTKTIKVDPNFPSFDLSQSGGIICTGNTTGSLYAKVDNTMGAVTYFIKKDTDANYPATGQTTPVFTGLTAGTYVVKAKTACYEVEQSLILRIPLSKVIAGSTTYCEGGSLWLIVNQAGPVSSIKWTAPDGTVYNTSELKFNNLTPQQSGVYKVEVTSLGGCYFTETFNVVMSTSQSPTGAAVQQFCKTGNAKVSDLAVNEPGVMWYDAAVDGDLIPATTALVNGKTYYGTLQLGNCKSAVRLAVTATISATQTPTGSASQEFCKTDNPTVSNLVTNETGVIWYNAATGGSVMTPETVLINGAVYYGSQKIGICESLTRFAVTVTVSDPKTPTGTASQEFCKISNPKVSNLTTTETGVIWYDAATAGNIIASTTALENNKRYYGSLKAGTCESPTRLVVMVTISDPKTPSGTSSQEFCKTNNPTVASLITNETGVIWYNAATGGSVVAATTALENGKVYYGSLKVGTCDSPTRLAVTVTLSDPKTPTGATVQEFCKANNSTVASLVTTETGVTWYDAASGGNIVAPAAILTNGTTYYGSLKAGNCTSPTRLAVTVTINDPKTPTGRATQEFCKVDNKKVADLVTTETNVTWYDAPTNGNKIASTAVLTNGTTYYGSLKMGTCESPTRLAVRVTINDAQTPTGEAEQIFCKEDFPRVADLITNEPDVIWYDASTGGNEVSVGAFLVNNGLYYATLKIGSCESPTRLEVKAVIRDPKAPTGAVTQEFCRVNRPRVVDLVTTEAGVIWYTAASGGTIVGPSTFLIDGTKYYGSLKTGTCESPTRLVVTVTIRDPKTPTGTASQEFCKVDNKKVSDLVTTESGVIWYDAATAGNVVASTTVLENSKVYYGSLKVGTCESPTRFAVTVTLRDPKTPTGTAAQEFCKVDNKKVSDLVTTESGVIWYNAAIGGNIVLSSVALTNGMVYYGSLKVGTCESPTRLAVTVTLSDPKTPTGATAQEFCKVDNKKVSDLVMTETGVTWYDAATAGTVIAPTTVLENNKIYYGSLKVGTCESPTRFAVTVTLSDPQTPTGTASQEFCKVDNNKVSDLVTTESGVTWYDAASSGNVIAPTTVLENNKIYYGSLKVGTCESPTRFAVTVTLSDPKTPTGATTQEFCRVDNKKVSDLATTESGVTWYDAATGGNVVPSTTTLTNGTVYYGSLKVGTCESPTRLAVTVTLSDPQTPTTNQTTQEFCKVDNKKVSDLATTESGVTWYDAATAGNVVPSTQALIDGTIYYGSLKVGTCESPTRLSVTVTLSDPQTPTTANTTQEFCKIDNKRVADLATTESGVTWYDAATAGTAIASTAVLENNKVYYGSLKVGTCESPTRLAVTVTLSDPQTPTTANTTQEFCKVDNKKVADLATTESGVTWYDAATAGNIVPSTAILTNGTVYYGSLKVGTCESPTRLAVTVALSDPQTPTTNQTTQEFCKIDNKKVSDLATTESGVTWYDAATAGNVVPSTTTLTNGTVYYGSLKVGTCESPTRLAVIVTLSDPQTPTTNQTTQEFCKVDNKKVSDLATTESGVTWYDAATAGNAVASTTILENNKVYYGSLKAGTCESPTRLAVTVTLSNPQTPTTNQTTQEFCKIDNKKVSDLATTESGVTWYDAATAGNVIGLTTVLEHNKIYYGSLKVGTCESPTRLAVTVILSDPQTPTTVNTTQEFCKIDNKKVSDLATTESGVTWYDAVTAGNVVPSTAILTNGTVYYGSLKVGTCESPTRLAVTVILSDPQTPTTANTTQEFCKVDNKKVSDLATTESGVTWYDAATAGNVVPATTTLTNGTVYYGSLKVGTCESPTRLAVTVTLSDPQTPTTANTTQEFCKIDNKKVADLATTESGVTWYDAATAGNIIGSTAVLENNKIYYGSLKVGTCESPTRLAVTVTLSDPKTPTTANTTQEFCKVDNKKVADLATTESGVTWYDAATAGNVIASTTVLENNKIYYGSLKVGTCESPTRLAVTVTLSDPQTPTTANTTQEFCKVDNKKVSDLATTESGVTWYDAATAGNVVPLTQALTDGTIYYGSLKSGTCESPTRLGVTVTLSDPQTPTTANTTQEFCKIDNKKVSDLATTESGVTWYDAATAGNIIASTTALENNKVYYGSLKVGTCESPTRLAVTVTLSDPQMPTTNQTTQEFCKVDNKKVSDLVTTESGVTWYDAATAGTALASTTALENNKVYYGSLKVGTCESPTRSAVTVTLSDPQTPTTSKTTQEFCKVDNKKVSDLATTESGVTWYDAATAGNVIASTAVLENNKIYYGSLKVGTCESPTRLAVTVILSDPKTPTTANTTQEFCKIDNKKVSDLATTESGVTWYDAATAGNVIGLTTVLEHNKIYYGSLKVGTCESPTRLAVTVTLSDPQTPTTVNTTQEFCKIDNKKVSDLATTESGVTWYDAVTAGNVVPSTTTLTNGTVYYGSLKVGTCESPTRLAVTVTLSDPQTPTTSKTTQEFCKVDNKKVSDLATTESGVTWYDAAAAGNVVPSTTILTNGTVYYGSLKVGTCESPTRLAVTVTLSDPQTPTTNQTTQEFCKIDNKTVADLATTESGVTWYDTATAGNIIASTAVLENNKIYYGSLKVGTCESPTRLAVTVTLSDPKTPTTVNTTQEFCKVDNKKVSDLATTESGVTWYDAATAGNVVPATTTLTNGTVYYGSLKVGTCESPTRLAVTITLSDPQTPTTQEFCKIDNKKVSDLATTESGVTWYDAATAGNVIASTTALENNKIYYGSLKVGTCESPTRLAVTVTLSDPQTPTTANTTQEFCKTDNKKVSDLATTESGVTWYDAATAGNIIASTAVLENNKVYYGSLKVGTCESPTRLAVTVTLSDPQTPTTNQTTQEFCKVDNKKVSDLATTESGVTWYDAATAGNIIASTAVLENNKIYYGSLKVGTCESPTRLAVTVTLSDPQTPTTANTTQEFCKVDNKKVADLATTESGVTWYDAATAGNVIASTTALENNKVYYGSLKVGTCESPTRLAVTVTLSDPQTPTTANTTQEFCKVDNKKVSDLATTESGVTWYDAAIAGNIVPATTILTNGTVYYGSLKVGTCESPTRLAITVTLSDPQTPTTANTTQEFCKIDNKKVSDLATTESGVTWYDAATAGTALASTTALENNKVYYGSLKVGTCESPTRLVVTVTLSDPQTPTGATTQEFCKVDNNKVSDLVTTESDVTWYDATTAGTVIAPTTVLENNKVYYGSLKVGTCESPTRFAVTVILSDPQTPTGTATQEFCKADNKKVFDLVTRESGVTWYDAATAGNTIASTTILEDNKVYYGSLKVGTCESPVRFAVTAIVKSNIPEPAPNWNSTTCAFDEVTYRILSGMSDYNWFVSKEGTIVAGGQPTDDYITVAWHSVGNATIKADYIDVSKCDPLVSVNYSVMVNSCSDIGLKKTINNANPFIGKEVVFTITAENFGTNMAKDITISEVLPSGYVYVASEVSSGSYNLNSGMWTLPILQPKESQTLKVTAIVKERGEYLNIVYLETSNPVDINESNNKAEASLKVKDVLVYNAVSPNGDDLNDYFRIDGLDQYPNNSVEIFNSGGIQIFKTNNYGSNNNVFRGISEGRATINKNTGVPTGSYFYILRYEMNGEKMEKSGYLYVNNLYAK